MRRGFALALALLLSCTTPPVSQNVGAVTAFAPR